jgi:uncharacterized integral membrane protein
VSSDDMQARRGETAVLGRPVTRKLVAAGILAAVAITFAALNLDEVEVNWLFGTWSTPLVVVIAVSFVLGAGGGYLAASRRARRRDG